MSLLPIKLFTEFLPLVSYCLVMSATPGPNNIMLATSGANFGYRGAMPTILGIQTGVFVQTVVTCVGLGSVFLAYPVIQALLRIAGSVYLIYLAWKLSGATIQDIDTLKPVSFFQAALFQALNPKSWIKSITLASVFMPTELSPLMGAILIACIGAMVGSPCSVMWTLFGVSIRHLLHDPFKRRVFNLLMGGTLVALAILFLR
ncbi:MAG: LysE family translocator [Undibacterium sp.]|nr:LysE family translocator [Undibacterium sp.]